MTVDKCYRWQKWLFFTQSCIRSVHLQLSKNHRMPCLMSYGYGCPMQGVGLPNASSPNEITLRASGSMHNSSCANSTRGNPVHTFWWERERKGNLHLPTLLSLVQRLRNHRAFLEKKSREWSTFIFKLSQSMQLVPLNLACACCMVKHLTHLSWKPSLVINRGHGGTHFFNYIMFHPEEIHDSF